MTKWKLDKEHIRKTCCRAKRNILVESNEMEDVKTVKYLKSFYSLSTPLCSGIVIPSHVGRKINRFS